MKTTYDSQRISRRGVSPRFAMPRLSADMPCLHPNMAIDDTGR